jgi:hypothetical protein
VETAHTHDEAEQAEQTGRDEHATPVALLMV